MQLRKSVRAYALALAAFTAPALGQELTTQDQDVLSGLLPGAPDIRSAVLQLRRSANEFDSASKRLANRGDCSLDRELIGLGASLANTTTALRRLRPLLLKPVAVHVGALQNATAEQRNAMLKNFQMNQDYVGATDKLIEASKTLSDLRDPLGSEGPAPKTANLIGDAGQLLLKADEQSGLANYLLASAAAIEGFRLAKMRFDKPACVHGAHAIGQTVELIANSLDLSLGVVWQSASSKALAEALYSMSLELPVLSTSQLDAALTLFNKSLHYQVAALRRQSVLALSLSGFGQPPDFVANYQSGGAYLAHNAEQQQVLAGFVEEARRALFDRESRALFDREKSDAKSALRNAGALLVASTPWHSTKTAGAAMVRVADLLSNNNVEAARGTLNDAVIRINILEKDLPNTNR